MKIVKRISITAMLVLAVSTLCVAQETRVSAKKVPRAVIAAFKSSYPQAVIRGYSKEIENGKVFYEIESTENGMTRDVLYHPDGTVAEVEESMPADELPQAVKDAMAAQYPKAVITLAEKVSRDGVTAYEVHARINKKRIEVKFDETGKVLEVE